MRSSNKATLAKLCKRHCYVLHIANHIHCYLSSVLKKNSNRKAKQSIAFGLLLLASALTTPISAQTVNICDRTDEVESAILAVIPGTPACTAVTATQLATITELNLFSMSIGSLQSDDFAGLTNLTELDLAGNLLTALPVNVFSALTNLGTLRLQGNTFATPLPADIFADLPSDAIIQIDLSPIGDLADVVLAVGDTAPIDLSSAFIFRDSFGIDISPTYNATSNNPAVVTVTNTGSMVTITAVDVGTTAVMVTASIPFSAPVIRTISVTAERSTRMSICDRTAEVRSAILAVIPSTSDCNLVTVDQLAAITELNLPGMNIGSLLSGDFAGLSGLIALDLSGNSLVALDADIFSGLTSLELLDLSINSLGTLDADIFSDLTSLIGVDLSNNSLSILPADVFDPLTNLFILFLERNNLGTLDANLFSALTSLLILDLSSNNLSALPAGLFSGLADLGVLFLGINTFTTPLPIDIFDDLPSGATIEIDLAPFGDLAVALDASGMDTIDLADAFISRDFNGNNRALSLTVTAMNTAIATVTATNTGARVTITAVAVGTTEVSVTANDGIDDVTRTISVTVETAMSICDRTPEVRNAIIAAIPSTSDCNLVTATQLARITELNLFSMRIGSLQSDDFAGLTSLTSLNLNNNNLSALPDDVFDPLTRLIFLNLSNNSLSTLNADVFDNLTNLEALYLNRNSLSTLPASMSDLTNLTRLGLSGNDLSGVLDADTFSTLTNLEQLDLSRTSLNTLPANIFDSLTSLIQLYLDDNSISTLPAGIFDPLTNLSLLSLYRNNLGTLDADVFSALTNLSILDLGINNLSALPAGLFSGLTMLDTLNLRVNTFTTPLPIDIFDDVPNTAVQIDLSPFGHLAVALDASGMTTIDLSDAFISRDINGAARPLSYSAIMSNDTAVATVTNTGSIVTITAVAVGTTAVVVTANDGTDTATRTISVTVEAAMSICDRTPEVQSAILAAIPETDDCNLVTATQLATITELNLFSMGIGALLPGDFAGLASLTSLTLNNNNLSALPAGVFGSLTNLIFLNLSNNSLSTLNADTFSALRNLTELYLFNNALTALPAGLFGSLTSLTELGLSNNSLSALPAGVFGSLTNLIFLNLSNNSISTLNADVFDNLTNLEELYLFNNALTALPGGLFDDLTSLTQLGLSDNSLSALPAGVFGSLMNLIFLNLSNNSLSTLERNTFSTLGNLESLYLFDNDLTALPAGLFGSLTNLIVLNLSNNSLSTLEGNTFSTLGNLQALYLFDNDLTTLPAGLFGSLTSLTVLGLSSNDLTTIEADTFSGLTGLTTLRLQGNTFTTPLPIDIFDDLPGGATIEIDLAPFGDLAGVALVASGMDTIDLSDAFISRDIDGDARTLSYGAIMSDDTAVATVTNTGSRVTITAVAVGTTAVSVTANDGIDDVTRTISVTVEAAMSICDRTAQVRDAILDAITATSDCNLVTATQLAAITELNLFSMRIETLLPGDFAGLDSLTSLILQDNSLSTLPANIFDNLTNLTTLDLSFNNLSALPAGIFDRLVNLAALVLWDNSLSTLERNVFSALGSLTYLDLTSNDLMTLPANIFDSLTSLTTLGLSFNPLTTPLPAELFDLLPDDAVIQIDLSPIGVLPNISSLTVLGTTTITVSDAFISRDLSGNDRALSFTVTPMNPAIATATVSGGVVTIRGVATGTTDVTITAADGTGTATRTISVTVIGVGIATYDAMTAGNQISTITIANENSGTMMFYVELMRAPLANVVMSVTSSDTNEGTVSPNTLTFTTTNWNSRQPVTVTAVDDNVDRDGDSFMADFEITTGDGGDYTRSLALPSVAVLVTDDDVASDTINLSISQSTITETADATTVTVTATIDGTTVLPTPTVVTVSVGGGTATSGTDYTAVPDFDLTIPALSSSATGTFMIDPTDDGAGDNGETVMITGTAGGFTINAATLTISEAGILVFDMPSGGTSTNTVTIANENSGTMMFYVQLISAPASDITLSLTSSNTNEGTVTPATLTFTVAAGATSWDSRQTLTVTAVPDNIARDDSFTVDFAITTGDTGNYPTTLAIPSVTVNITDDDTAGIALFDMATGADAPSITTSEGATTDSFYVALTSEPTDTVTVTIGFRAEEHTLPPLFGTTLTFTPTGATAWNIRQAITLTGVNDDVVDGDRTYDLTLTPTGGGYEGVTPETVSVTNTDDDTAVLTITNTTISVNEDVGMAEVTMTLTPAVTAGNVEVDATTTDGMATGGTDYTALTSETLTFRAGSTTQTLNIPINNDLVDEDNEDFTVTLDNLMLPAIVAGDVSIADSTATITITDDDTVSTTIGLTVSPPTVAETGGATTVTVAAILGSAVVLTTETDVMVTVGGGTATSGTDYATVADFTMTIPALSSSATQTFTIDPTDDGTGDNGETVMISGAATINGMTATVNPATLTIVEAGISVHDAMILGNPISTATIAEASSDILYVQLASEPAASSSVTISVASSASGEGTVSPGTLTFTDTNWDTRQALTVTAVDDNIDRENDTFMVNFAVISGDGVDYTSSLDLSSVEVLVTDNDDASDTIVLTVSLDNITETAGEISITVTATLNGAASATDTAVEVIINDEGTATPNTDYTLAMISDTITLPTSALTTITIPAELTSGDGTFAITPVADDESDNGETITISGTSGSLTVNAATLTIIEFSREDQQAIEQTVAVQASGVTQVVTEQIGIRLASHISAGSAQERQSLSSIDWQDRLAKFTYEGLKRLDSGADIMSLDWLFKAASGNGQVLMPLGAEALTLWATGGHISTKGDGVADYEGDVRSFILGVDTALANDWLVGVAISYNDSEIGYTMEGTPEANKTEQTLYGIHPYLSRTISKGLTLWATGGYGFGDVDFSDTRFGNTTSDVTQWMAAGGLEQQIITNTPWQGALRIKGLWGNAEVDATGYSGGIRIAKIESDFWRAHMESEMGYNFSLPGGTVRPYAIIGGRWDHNDAIVSGDEWHVDVGGGVEVIHPAFALNISVRTQVTEGDTEEDSIFATGSLTYDLEQDGRGLQIALSRPLDNTLPAFDSHSFSPLTDTVSGLSGAPLTSELAYGWTVHPFGLEGALQTYTQTRFESSDRHYAVGLELAVSALTLNFETGYHTNLDNETRGGGLESLFKTKIRW